MRTLLPGVVILFLTAVPQAQAIVTLGQSLQNFGLTGIGNNSAGEGQSVMSWGSCAFDGTNTNCTLSGPFTGLGAGGTYSFVLSYPGQGAFPLTAISQSPGSNLFTAGINSAASNTNYSLVITLAETNGTSIHFYSFANFNFTFTSAAVCTVVAATNCGVASVGGTPGATIFGPITGSFDPTPYISGVISASNYGGFKAIAPATWIEIYGYNLANTLTHTWASTDFVNNVAPTTLAGTSVTVGGIPAYVYFVTPGQLNVQVPSGLTAGPQPLVVTTAGGSSTPYTVTVNTVEPGVLAPASFIINGYQNIVALFSNTLTYDLPLNVAGVVTSKARPGDTLTMYGIGFGTVTPSISAGLVVSSLSALTNSLTITFGGVPATITYAGLAPGYVGLYQFNVVVPNVAASNTVPVVFTLNGATLPQTTVIAIGS
jgi:uncharacterized protein (TIGR03437 family)